VTIPGPHQVTPTSAGDYQEEINLANEKFTANTTGTNLKCNSFLKIFMKKLIKICLVLGFLLIAGRADAATFTNPATDPYTANLQNIQLSTKQKISYYERLVQELQRVRDFLKELVESIRSSKNEVTTEEEEENNDNYDYKNEDDDICKIAPDLYPELCGDQSNSNLNSSPFPEDLLRNANNNSQPQQQQQPQQESGKQGGQQQPQGGGSGGGKEGGKEGGGEGQKGGEKKKQESPYNGESIGQICKDTPCFNEKGTNVLDSAYKNCQEGVCKEKKIENDRKKCCEECCREAIRQGQEYERKQEQLRNAT